MARWEQRGLPIPHPPNTACVCNWPSAIGDWQSPAPPSNTASPAFALGIPSLLPAWLPGATWEPPPCASLVHPLCIWTYNVNVPLPPRTRNRPKSPPRTNGIGPVPNRQNTGLVAARQTHHRVELSVQHECQRKPVLPLPRSV